MKYPEENDMPKGEMPENLPDQPESQPQDEAPAAEDFPPAPPTEDGLEKPEFDFSGFERGENEPSLEELGFTPLTVSETPPPPRRRRARRSMLNRPAEDEIIDRLEAIASRAIPTFDFFIFSIISAALVGLGYLLDAPAILLFGVLAAPILAPWVGVSLATASGEGRFLGQTLGGFFTAILAVFLVGLLTGLASRIFMPLTFNQAYLHARLWWPDLLLLIVGTIILVISFIQSEDKPILASLMVAYEFYLPVSAAGFGIGNGLEGIFPQALTVFMIHLAISLILSLIVFYYMGFRPMEPSGYAWGASAIVISLVIVAGFLGLGSILDSRTAPSANTATPEWATQTPSVILPPPATFTPAPSLPPTVTRNPVTPTAQPSDTPSPVPTPVFGRIQARGGGDGATIRETPGGTAITTIQNGYLVEILPDAPITLESAIWIRVRVNTPSRVIEGWVLLSLVVTPTPSP